MVTTTEALLAVPGATEASVRAITEKLTGFDCSVDQATDLFLALTDKDLVRVFSLQEKTIIEVARASIRAKMRRAPQDSIPEISFEMSGLGGPYSASSSLLKARQQVQEFWISLQKACVKNGFLRLRKGDSFLGSPMKGHRILMRESYESILQRIDELLDQGLRRFLITGTPGIGKSFFMFPLMHWLLQKKGVKRIVLEIEDLRYYFCVGESVISGGPQAFEGVLGDEETWWIMDKAKGREREAYTVLLSSPSQERCKEFLKLMGCTCLYMPVWSIEEIEKCRTVIYSHLTAGAVADLYEKWGGIPRFVLEKANDVPAQEMLENSIKQCSWVDVMSCVYSPETAKEVSHKVLHRHVKPDSGCQKYFMAMASPYVERELLIRGQETKFLELQKYFVQCMSSPATKGMAGTIFEAFAHKILQKGGDFKVRMLHKVKSKACNVETISFKTSKKIMEFDDLEEVWEKAADGQYCQPRKHNFPAIDSLSQPESLFQMTVAQKKRQVSAGYVSAAQYLRGPRKRIYFVVDEETFETFKHVHGVPAELEQWVLEVPTGMPPPDD
ncbi:hypothetical protein CEUSTIGMA_g7033.t1 [Chlamydomonas eustigma]|uniref:Uncharacterized protein n=1 Tax=Chlamydomonas eustigma TaxID=1157962 RepID=A0A250X9Q7_9CHLO|nr:hypothetical protein CEUSTIGMA_g7033.t1 [Chlamydomonas eustigma]|eukprot:GAX79592.1 hypothetical protein CEUSTIGMA_g7033.t1 [Chlamydomonas eustigma]